MKKPIARLISLLHKPVFLLFAAFIALALVCLCFVKFRVQVNAYTQEDMHTQIEAIQQNSVQLVQTEMRALENLTASAAVLLSRAEIQTDEEILEALSDYAQSSKVVRALFVTLDGHAYTSYAGYLGQSEENTSLDGVALSEITSPVFSRALYSADLDKVIFGVLAPVTMGERQGVLVSSYNISELSTLLENSLIGGEAEVGILARDGAVISSPRGDVFGFSVFDSLRPLQFEQSSAEEMERNMAAGTAGYVVYTAQNVSRYCAYAPVELNDWFVIVNVKEGTLSRKLSSLEHYGFELTVEIFLLIAGLAFLVIAAWRHEQRRTHAILERAARTDGLTGAFNRKAAEDRIDEILKNAGEDDCAALLIVDMDDFKKINDQGGHLFGDTVLRTCVKRLKGMFGTESIVGRIGGDEFVVFLPDGSDIDAIEAKITTLICSFSAVDTKGEHRPVSMSVGIAQTAPERRTFLALYQAADAALYRAKQKGKARFEK